MVHRNSSIDQVAGWFEVATRWAGSILLSYAFCGLVACSASDESTGRTGGTAGLQPSAGGLPTDGERQLPTGESDGSEPPQTADSGDSATLDADRPTPPVTTDPFNPTEDLDSIRQSCVDQINQYRATLNLEPLRRATEEQEACSDRGAEQDATTGGAHSSAGSCPGLGGQNTCPGYSGDLERTLQTCLTAMWDEGPPPIPIEQCQEDYIGCFGLHGHYINMSNDRYSVVACGFYEMSPGKWWMNQNFGY